jgi:hypothetical protein
MMIMIIIIMIITTATTTTTPRIRSSRNTRIISRAKPHTHVIVSWNVVPLEVSLRFVRGLFAMKFRMPVKMRSFP